MIGPFFKSFFLVVLVIAACAVHSSARAGELLQSPVETCKRDLLAERDKQWPSKLREALRKHQISEAKKKDYERLKQELRDNIKYLGFIDPTSDFALTAGEIFQAIKTKADLIEDLLGFVSPAKAAPMSAKILYEIINKFRRLDDAIEEGVAYMILQIYLDVNPVVGTITHLAENIETAVRMPGEQESFTNEMERQFSRLDREIAKAEAGMRAAEKDTRIYNELGKAIEMYCNNNPENVTAQTTPEEKPDETTSAELMDKMVDTKREIDGETIMDQLVAGKLAYDQSLLSSQNSDGGNGDAANQFIGNLFEGLIMGLGAYSGSGGYSGYGNSSGTGCQQVLAQIQANRNWLRSNGGTAAAGAVRQAYDENVNYYNQHCR